MRVQNMERDITIEQDWRMNLTGVRRNRVLTEIRGIQWLDGGGGGDDGSGRICFSTGLDAGVEVYDRERNLKWRFAPTEEDSSALRPGNRSATAALWSGIQNMLVCMNPDGVVRLWKLD